MRTDTRKGGAPTPLHGAPKFKPVTLDIFRTALRKGMADLKAAPFIGLCFSLFYFICGWILVWITLQSETTYWLVLAATGFPLIGPFAAVGFYDISRKRQANEPVIVSEVLSVIFSQRLRQLPSISAVIVIVVMFWFFLGHMVFALFLGHMPMVNVSTSLEVFTTPQGASMLLFGSAVGAGFAIILFNISVLALPMLLDREVDFVTAMLTSFQVVLNNPVQMLGWGLFIAVLTFLALVPWFLGLFLVLPLLGHATWHVYDLLKEEEAA
ncbi:DUF2189 domain-containing protein [Primorskyibacter sp. S187A]|uniref:DUF2189 domain-containing protein n=1 Tax=Primorskyibacter sp. S187A TaxID=3415130 RepID=UPI003C7B2A43